MRTRGHSFVILTIALPVPAARSSRSTGTSFTNGTAGLSLPIPMWDLAYQYWPFYYALVLLLALSLLMAWRIRRTKFGMGLIAMREDEDKAATVGINTPVYKMLGFVASGVFLGMAGGVYAYYLAFIDPRGMFDIVISVQIILCMLLGGRGTLWGPVLGAFLIEPLNELANQQMGGGNSRLLIFGGLMALVVLFLPQGHHPDGRGATSSSAAAAAAKAALVGARLDGPLVIARARGRAGRATRSRRGEPLLEVKGLAKHFGGVKAVDDCSFAVPQGSITALIGPNGSGKTTVFNLIDGTMRPTPARCGSTAAGSTACRRIGRAHLGLGRTFQITRLFREMTVLENVVAPLRSFSLAPAQRRRASAATRPRAPRSCSTFVGMERFRDQKAAALSYGQQKLVELAQVLMLDPKLILLDEPAGGINPTLIERMGEMIRAAQPPGHDVPDRRAQHAVRARAVRPGPRARARHVHLRGRARGRPAGPARARRVPRRGLRARAGGGVSAVTLLRSRASSPATAAATCCRASTSTLADGLDRLHRRPERRRQVDRAARRQRPAAAARAGEIRFEGEDDHGPPAGRDPRARDRPGPAVQRAASRTSRCARTC